MHSVRLTEICVIHRFNRDHLRAVCFNLIRKTWNRLQTIFRIWSNSRSVKSLIRIRISIVCKSCNAFKNFIQVVGRQFAMLALFFFGSKSSRNCLVLIVHKFLCIPKSHFIHCFAISAQYTLSPSVRVNAGNFYCVWKLCSTCRIPKILCNSFKTRTDNVWRYSARLYNSKGIDLRFIQEFFDYLKWFSVFWHVWKTMHDDSRNRKVMSLMN